MSRAAALSLWLAIVIASSLQLGCTSSPAQIDKPDSVRQLPLGADGDDKITALLHQSRTTAATPGIALLAQKAQSNRYDAESLYDLAYAHLQHARLTQNSAELNLAAHYFREILLLVPGNQAVIAALYNIYYDDILHDRNSDALPQAKALLLQMPSAVQANMNPPSLAKFAAVARHQKAQRESDRQLLRELLLQSIQEQPHNDNAYIQLARLYSEDRYFSLAIATLKLAAENITDSVQLYKTIASTYDKRANANNCSYEHPRDIANTAAYYKLAVSLTPNDQDLHYRLANAFIDQGQANLGLHESSIALDLQVSDLSLAATAQDYSILSRPQAARQLLERALHAGMPISEIGYHEINMNLGEWQKASEGFAAYINTKQTFSVYDLLKSDIIAQQSQQPSWLSAHNISFANNWEQTLFDYWNGTLSAAAVQKKAINRCEKTEFYFYSGYRDWQNGERAVAQAKFTEALKQNTYRFIERPLARYFLQK